MQLIGSCMVILKYNNNFINIDLEPLFYNRWVHSQLGYQKGVLSKL
jgi:hypothetical protein